MTIVHKAQKAYSNLAQVLDRSKVMCETIIQKEKSKEPRTAYKYAILIIKYQT